MCSAPLGLKTFRYSAQGRSTGTVAMTKSQVFFADGSEPERLISTNRSEPKPRASVSFPADVEKTVTAQPVAPAYRTAKCPRPPSPTTPTRELLFKPRGLSGANTVIPAQRRGAALSEAKLSGISAANRASTRTWPAYPPARLTQVGRT